MPSPRPKAVIPSPEVAVIQTESTGTGINFETPSRMSFMYAASLGVLHSTEKET